MNIKETFLKLTSKTYPYGTEDLLLPYLPDNIQEDKHGNYFLKIGESKSIFAAHLDTVSTIHEDVTHVMDGKYIRTDGKTTLGADDKAGVTVLLYMIENKVPGLYYFFVGEEVGCVGSGYAALDKQFEKYNKIISFDRRDCHSIITHQSWQRTASDKFCQSIADQLNEQGLDMMLDDGGSCTDSLSFVEVISECTNISVGYYKEHTFNEHQDIDYLEALCRAIVNVDWENLPIDRKPGEDDWDEYFYGRYGRRTTTTKTKSVYSAWGARTFHDEYDEYETHYIENVNDDEEDYTGKNVRFEDFFEEEEEYLRMCSANNSIKPNIYFDSLDNVLNYDPADMKEYDYTSILDKYLDDRLSDEEIDTIIDQFLDSDDPRDIEFAKELQGMKRLKNHQV